MKYSSSVICPDCGYESENHNFKREWISMDLNVNEISCKSCGFVFRVYFGSRKDGSDIVYTIPKNPF